MKIVHFIPGFNFGGIESLFTNLIYNISSNFEIELIVEEELSDKTSLKKIEEFGIRIHYVPRFKFYNIISYTCKLKSILESIGDVDIVHSHNVTRSFALFVAAKLLKINHRIFHARTNKVNGSGLSRVINLIFLKLSIKYATRLIANSEKSGDSFFGTKDYSIIKNGINIKKFKFNSQIREQLRTKFNLDNSFVLGHVGRFTSAKNHKFLLEFFSKLDIRNKKLMLVGDGPLRDEINKEIIRLDIEDEIICVGQSDKVEMYYSAFDLFVLPSNYEGFGNVVVEALSSGLNVVASDNVPKSTNVNGNVKYLPLEINVWINKIETMNLNDKYIRENSYKTVLGSGFDLIDNVKAHEELYMEIVSR